MGGVIAWRNSKCVQGLTLSCMSPWTRSFLDERGIETAISIIKKSPYSGSEAINLLREAAKWSISSAAGWDPKKRAFLVAVEQGKGSRFLLDVVEEYQNQNSRPRYEGSCGHTVASGSYMAYMEAKVFGTRVSTFGDPHYEPLLRDALGSVAGQLERDLDSAIRENDYITDETADKLKAVVSDLDHCGVSTGLLNSKIEKLAWFVGGDPAKIKELQKALNDLGVGQHLEEDGVYGEKTKEAVDKVIDKISEFLADRDKICRFIRCIDLYFCAMDCLNGFQTQFWLHRQAVKSVSRELQRTVWKLGAEYYLRPRGYDVAALLLEHSLNKSPSNLYFPESHWVAQKIIKSKRFQTAFSNLEKKIQENPEVYAVDGSMVVDFQGSDTDLYYGIGKCSIEYTCTRKATSVQINFTIEDKYNFDRIRSIRGDVERFVVVEFELGNLANDAGLISQADGAISMYHSYISFKKIVHLN